MFVFIIAKTISNGKVYVVCSSLCHYNVFPTHLETRMSTAIKSWPTPVLFREESGRPTTGDVVHDVMWRLPFHC